MGATKRTGPEHPDLIAAGEDIAAAEAIYRGTLTRVRAECQHTRVVERQGGSHGADLGRHAARRICCDCGYEETDDWHFPGRPWCGTNSDEGHTSAPRGTRLVLTTEFVNSTPFGSAAYSQYRPLSEAPTPPLPARTTGERT